MSRPQKTLFGTMALAQGLHFIAFLLLWGGWLAPFSLPISMVVLFLIGWNLVLAVQASRQFPWVEPLGTAYAMAAALRMLVFTCAVLLPLIQRQTSPSHWGPFYTSLLTTLVMQGLGLATILRIPRPFVRS
jgi:hypothetical protein